MLPVIEQATILAHTTLPGNYTQLRVLAPTIARAAQPGHFCHAFSTRPLYVMRLDAQAGWIDFLYQTESPEFGALADYAKNVLLDIEGPFGNAFNLEDAHHTLIIGEKLGLAPLVFLCQRLMAHANTRPSLFLLGDDGPFPFIPKPSLFIVPVPAGVIACMPLMEDWKIPSRLANQQSLPGCYEGSVIELARDWLEKQHEYGSEKSVIFACGSTALVAQVSELSARFNLASPQTVTLN